MTDYLLDTNVPIKAKNRYYGFDSCLAFWNWLVEKNHAGKVVSIKEVAEELNKGEDNPTDWAEARGDDFFLKSDGAVVSKLCTVSDWVSVNGYQPGTVATFYRSPTAGLSRMRLLTIALLSRTKCVPTP